MKITINNMRVYAHHGVLPEEQSLGGRFAVDLELEYNASAAADSDDLHHAVDYQSVASAVQSIMQQQRFKLLEALAGHIVDQLLRSFPRLNTVGIRLRKLHLPLEQMPDFVQVEHSRSRSQI